jgi:hypothetical protein
MPDAVGIGYVTPVGSLHSGIFTLATHNEVTGFEPIGLAYFYSDEWEHLIEEEIMKRAIRIALLTAFILSTVLGGAALASPTIYFKHALTGNTADTLDGISPLATATHPILMPGDIAFVFYGGRLYEYVLINSYTGTSNPPGVVSPAISPGTNAWILQGTAAYVDSRAFASLNLAHAAAVATGLPVKVLGTCSLSSNLTTTAPISVEGGGVISQGSGAAHTLTINGPFHSDGRVFVGFSPGQVSFGGATSKVRPEWWGAVGDDSTDNTNAFQCAIQSLYALVNGSGVVGTVRVGKGQYVTGKLIVSNLTDAGGIQIVGEGPAGTFLILKAATNDVMFDIGGATSSCFVTFVKLSNLKIDGNKANQATAAALVRMRLVDRSWIDHVQIQNSAGQGIILVGTTAEISDSTVYNSGGDGLLIDSCTSVYIHHSFINDNLGYGINIQYTGNGLGTAPNNITSATAPVSSQDLVHISIKDDYFEKNSSGDVYVNGVDNVSVEDNRINPLPTIFPVDFEGICRRGRVMRNFFQTEGSDIPTAANASIGNYFVVKFGAHTYNNFHGFNSGYHLGTDVSTFSLKDQVQDLGQNYYVENTEAHIQQFRGQEISHQGSGFQTFIPTAGGTGTQKTNYALWSEDLTNAVWTLSGSVYKPIANVSTFGSPASLTDNSTLLSFDLTSGHITTLTQTVSVSVASGDLWTFSVWMRRSLIGDGAGIFDVRLRILDSSNHILSETDYRPLDGWERFATSFVASRTYTSLQVQIYRRFRGGSYAVPLWGAQLNKGDLAPYIMTTSAPVAVNPGMAGLSVTSRGDMTVSLAGKGLVLTNAAGTIRQRVRLNDTGNGLIFENP